MKLFVHDENVFTGYMNLVCHMPSVCDVLHVSTIIHPKQVDLRSCLCRLKYIH